MIDFKLSPLWETNRMEIKDYPEALSLRSLGKTLQRIFDFFIIKTPTKIADGV